jgi:hypothetical protein
MSRDNGGAFGEPAGDQVTHRVMDSRMGSVGQVELGALISDLSGRDRVVPKPARLVRLEHRM